MHFLKRMVWGIRTKIIKKKIYESFMPQELGDLFGDIKTIHMNEFGKKIKTMSLSTQREREMLLELSLLSGIQGDIVEIGSWLGGTTSYLAKGCQISGNGKVHAIDHFLGNPGKEDLYWNGIKEGLTIYETFLENVEKAGVKNFIIPYKMSSATAREQIMLNDCMRILFIDGNHEYANVKNDIALWEPLLSSKGFLVIHDFGNLFPGVLKAAGEEITRDKYDYVYQIDSLLVAKKK